MNSLQFALQGFPSFLFSTLVLPMFGFPVTLFVSDFTSTRKTSLEKETKKNCVSLWLSREKTCHSGQLLSNRRHGHHFPCLTFWTFPRIFLIWKKKILSTNRNIVKCHNPQCAPIILFKKSNTGANEMVHLVKALAEQIWWTEIFPWNLGKGVKSKLTLQSCYTRTGIYIHHERHCPHIPIMKTQTHTYTIFIKKINNSFYKCLKASHSLLIRRTLMKVSKT